MDIHACVCVRTGKEGWKDGRTGGGGIIAIEEVVGGLC